MREELQLVTVEQIVSDPQAYENKMVKVGGWVRSNRDSKSIGFIVLGDGSCFTTLQIVYEDRIASFASAAKLGAGTAIIAEGTIVLTPMPASLLRCMRRISKWKALQHRIIRCRRRGTLSNT